jgi:hypothetical protein
MRLQATKEVTFEVISLSIFCQTSATTGRGALSKGPFALGKGFAERRTRQRQ